MKRKLLPVIGILILIAFTLLAVSQVRDSEHQLKLKNVQLQERGAELKKLELKYQNLNVELDKTEKTNGERIQQLVDEKAQLDAERQRLERELQAKLERQEAERVAAEERKNTLANAIMPKAAATPAKPVQTASFGGNKQSWLAASGIPQSDWQAVDYIVSKESSWNPNAVNPNGGACGLAQSLPCGKQAKYGAWNDPVANLKWQHEYVTTRYGGYWGAYNFWLQNHWY